jgi:hypothetical protein
MFSFITHPINLQAAYPTLTVRPSQRQSTPLLPLVRPQLEPSWNVMAHGDAREGKWRGNRRMEWVVSTLRTTSEHGVSSITTEQTSAASSRLNSPHLRFKWTPFRRKTKSGFCAYAITFQTQSTTKRKHNFHHHYERNNKITFTKQQKLQNMPPKQHQKQ